MGYFLATQATRRLVPLPVIQNIVFDMDGVLADTSSIHAQAYDKLWAHVGLAGPNYPSIAGRSTKDVVSEQTRSLLPSAQDLEKWINFKQKHALELIRVTNTLYDEIPSVIADLTRKAIRCSVATSASHQSATAILGQSDLIDKFVHIITAKDVKTAKPSPEGFLLAMRQSQFDPNATLIIEDSSNGIQAALASNAWVISVRSDISVEHEHFIGSYSSITRAMRDLL